jgi:hypothetical protein
MMKVSRTIVLKDKITNIAERIFHSSKVNLRYVEEGYISIPGYSCRLQQSSGT